VGGVAETKSNIAGARRVEVETQVALACVLLRVVARDLAVAGERLPGQIATRRLELDDFGPQVEQCLGAVGASEHTGEINDADALERKRHAAHLPSNSAMPMPFSRYDLTAARKSAERMIGRWISAMASSAASIPSLTATETRRLVAACAIEGP